jgi:hypothetical protein
VILEAVPDEPVDIARKGLEAYQRGDVDAVFEVATDDVEFIVPDSMANSGTYVGRAGFETMMRQWEEAWDEFRVEIVELISRPVKFRVGKSVPRCDTRLEWTRWLAPSSRGSITRIR